MLIHNDLILSTSMFLAGFALFQTVCLIILFYYAVVIDQSLAHYKLYTYFMFQALIDINNKIDKINMKLVNQHRRINPSSSCSNLPSRRPSTASLTSTAAYQTDLFQGLYKGTKIIGTESSTQLIQYKGVKMQMPQLIRMKSKSYQRNSKTVEQLIEQNMQLKNQINELKQTISRIKGKFTAHKQPGNGLGINNAEIQYHRDAYWSMKPSLYRVEGVKQQYDKLKKQFDEQAKEMKQIKGELLSTKLPEMQIYITYLQQQNKRLRDNILQIKTEPPEQKTLQNSPNPIKTPNRSPSAHPKPKTIPITLNFKKAQQKPSKTFSTCVPKQSAVIKQLQQQINQKNKQIQFLEKSIIMKGNSEHNASCRLRKLRKNYENLMESYKDVKDRVEDDEKKLEVMKAKIIGFYQHQLDNVKKQHHRALHEKDHKIKQLQKALKNVETVAANNNNKSRISNGRSLLTKTHHPRKSSHDFLALNINIREQDEQDLTISRRPATQHNEANQNSEIFQENGQLNSSIVSKSKKSEYREPKRPNRKYDDNSVRARKVQIGDVKQIAELLRFRLIANRVEQGHIKQYFSRKVAYSEDSDRSNSKNQKNFFQTLAQAQEQHQKEWQDEYITMKQCKQTLKNHPYSLAQDEASTLSRYLIQDNEQEYQYVYEYNETKRQIVKSIIKSLIGTYQLPTSSHISQYNYMLDKYGSNIKSVLMSVAPAGLIDRRKLVEVVVGVGAEPNDKVREILIANASLRSVGLGQLRYMDIFQYKHKGVD